MGSGVCSPGTFIWVADNNGGGTSLYNDDGTIASALPFVTIPAPAECNR